MDWRYPQAKMRFERPDGYPFAGTKIEEKQNLRVQFLHTSSHNYLILFISLPHPSSGRLPSACARQ